MRRATLALADGTVSEGLACFLHPKGLGFPGTLVAFELPVAEVQDYDGLMTRIYERAKQRTPQRATHRWLRFDPAPSDAHRFLINVASEDTLGAQRCSEEQLQPKLLKRVPVSLNFANFAICTQSFLHALLFDAIRVAWARETPIFIEQASPAVKFADTSIGATKLPRAPKVVNRERFRSRRPGASPSMMLCHTAAALRNAEAENRKKRSPASGAS